MFDVYEGEGDVGDFIVSVFLFLVIEVCIMNFVWIENLW